MNLYKMSLVFPEVSESIPVTIKASSAEGAQDSVCASEDTRLQIDAGNPDGNSEVVSVVYAETIRVSKAEITSIYTHIFGKADRDSNISKTVQFPDGMEMDIAACSGTEESESGWTEAILFQNGSECAFTDVENKFEGVWCICRGGVMYIAVVVPEVNLWDTPEIITLPGSCLESTAQVIAHQTNCVGVMGGGVAKAIRDRYPEIMPEYQAACQTKNMLGECQLIATEDEHYVANLFGQCGIGGGLQTDYNALQSAVNSLIDLMQARGLTFVSMPYNLGCGLAGGDWDVVFTILRNAFAGRNILLELWMLS